jgi:hypothetical protein
MTGSYRLSSSRTKQLLAYGAFYVLSVSLENVADLSKLQESAPNLELLDNSGEYWFGQMNFLLPHIVRGLKKKTYN